MTSESEPNPNPENHGQSQKEGSVTALGVRPETGELVSKLPKLSANRCL